ncbi:MAG: cyclic nucleotide-binding domain-containing protein [Anaerolineae bacterium]|nr:cyclic nucleotide-binding domain-containing protein [Anaerolineae bacterium]
MTNQVPIFAPETDYVSYSAGQTIFAIGDSGDEMYSVKEGEVEISYHGTVLDVVKEGGIFGEMALIDDTMRSAVATAKTDCKLIAVNQKRFIYMVQNTPFFAITVMRIMAERLRKLDRLRDE